MLNALRALGIKIKSIDNSTVEITGTDGNLRRLEEEPTIHLGNSGTSSRFLMVFLCLFPKDSSVILKSDPRLNKRPIMTLIDLLVAQKLIKIEHLSNTNSDASQAIFPMRVTSLGNHRNVKDIEILCSDTSQFATALLL